MAMIPNRDIDDMFDHLEDPCPLGCSDNEFTWWPIELHARVHSPAPGELHTVGGPVYAYDCATCGYFVVPASEREWLLTRNADFSFGEVRAWVRQENRSVPPKSYRSWPWLTHDMLQLFRPKLMRA
jgi:hypothetical protein